MNKSTHIIHKQTIEVTMPPGKSPFAVQEKIRQVYYDKILARLDKLFSELVTGDVIIRLDRLDLELGFVDGERLEQEVVEKTIRTAQMILKEKLQFGTGGGQGMDVIPVERSTADLLLYFLEYGRLPWWSRMDDLGRLESGIMEKGPVSAGFRAKFPALMEEVPAARQRLLFQFSDPFLQFILSACFPGAASGSAEECAAWFKTFYGDAANDAGNFTGKEKRAGEKDKGPGEGNTGMEESGPGKTDRKKGRRPTGDGQRITDDGTVADDGASTEPDGQSSVKRNPAKPGDIPSPEEYATSGTHSKIPGPAADNSTNDIYPSPEASPSSLNDPLPPETDPGKRSGNGKSAGERTDGKHTPETILRRGQNQTPVNRRDDKEPIYAELAGLVILQPFLAGFFTALHLVEGKNFRNEASRNKAVFLLGYLATGSAEIQEHRLVFPKVLCGMDLASPIERTGIITPEEMEEAETLITTVITYWKALKSTTTDGLRDSFLQREGRLSRKDDGWQLDVEKKTLDILLGKLPWGFSIIRLPWMKEMIFVSWG